MINSNSQSRAGSGCFSGIARLLLCRGSLQTHPSDQIIEPDTKTEFNHFVNKAPNNEVNVKIEAASSATPGVVARLMGLDSLPPNTNWVPIPNGRTTPDSVTRSRSVNFMDYLLQFDLSQSQHQNYHRRVRTSVSFREVPTLLTNENQHDFFLLYLDDMEKNKKTESKQRKAEVGSEEIKQRKKEEKFKMRVINNNNTAQVAKKNQQNNLKISKLKNEPRKQLVSSKQFSRFGSCRGAQVSSGFVSPHKKDHRPSSKEKSPTKAMNNQKEVLVESKFMKKIKKHALKDLQHSECSSENSSPVSVLDLVEFSILDENPLSDGSSQCQDSNPEKKCSQKTSNLDNYPFPDPSRLLLKSSDDDDDTNKYYIKVARQLCKLTEEDIKESNWVSKNLLELENFEEICLDFGQQILDLLVKQLVEELVGFQVKVSI